MRKFADILTDKRIRVLRSGDDGCMGNLFLPTGKLVNFVFSFGGGWEHLSVSTPHSCPTWDDMCAAKDLFFNKDECCVQYHPAEKNYVNHHQFCLHIWRPLNEKLPEPPTIFV